MRHVLAPAWIAFAFLAIAASPAHFWLDSGEIAAAGAGLGVMHPTGVPGYIPILHLATALPIGSLGLRMAVVSSACMAGAIALLLAILHRRGAHWALLWVIGLWLPLGLTLARQGRVVEIYGFGALVLLASLWGFDPEVPEHERVSRRCLGSFAAVIGAWGFGDLRLALVLPVVLTWILAWRRAEPWARWAPLCVGLASLVVLSLPLSSSRGPIADWGDPETASGVWAHVQATLIRDAYATKLGGMGPSAWLLHARAVAARLVEDLGPFGFLLAAAALLFGLARPPPRSRAEPRLLHWIAWIVVVELVYAVAINPMGGHDRQTGLALGLLAALALGLGVHRATQDRAPLRWVALPLLACALWIPAAFESLGELRVARSWAPHGWTREVLARTPSDALVLAQSDDLNAGLVAARALEGARPDLVAIPAQHLYRRPSEWQRGTPRRARVWDAVERAEARPGGEGGRSRPETTQGERRAKLAGDRVYAALGAWQGAVVLESPSTGVFTNVSLPGAGEPPIWITELPIPAGARPPSVAPPDDPLGVALERWRGRLDNPVDREHVADALALWVNGEFARAPESPLRWLRAERDYRRILTEILPEHPRSLVGLAATQDYFGRTDDAIALTRLALELDPGRPTALANLASYLSRDPASLAEARALAELAASLAADQRNVWLRLLLVCQTQADEACVARAEARLAGM